MCGVALERLRRSRLQLPFLSPLSFQIYIIIIIIISLRFIDADKEDFLPCPPVPPLLLITVLNPLELVSDQLSRQFFFLPAPHPPLSPTSPTRPSFLASTSFKLSHQAHLSITTTKSLTKAFCFLSHVE